MFSSNQYASAAYSFQPCNGTVVFDTIGSSFDTVLAVYTGSAVANLTSVASDNDSGGDGTSQLTFSATAGTTYRKFRLTVTGLAGTNYIVQANTNLNTTNWVARATNASPFSFTDANMTNYSQRFFRAICNP